MGLNKVQQDAFCTLGNLSAKEAASQLSEIICEQVIISNKNTALINFNDIHQLFSNCKNELVCISQQFEGIIEGQSRMIFDKEDSKKLISAFIGNIDNIGGENLSEYESEAIAELGNIIITNYLTNLSEYIHTQFTLSIPDFYKGRIDKLVNDLKLYNTKNEDILTFELDIKVMEKSINASLFVWFNFDILNTTFSDKIITKQGSKHEQ